MTLSRAWSWVTVYKWPIYFFVAVAFWNLTGAGLFGILINPPIVAVSHAGAENRTSGGPLPCRSAL